METTELIINSRPSDLSQAETRLLELQLKLSYENDSTARDLLREQCGFAEKLVSRLIEIDREVSHATEVESANSRAFQSGALMEEFIESRDIIYLAHPDTYFLKWGGHFRQLKPNSILHEFDAPRIPHTRKSVQLLSEKVQQMKRNYYDREYRIGSGTKGYYNLFKSDLAPLCNQPVHFAFDLLMQSLGDGRQENIEHLEQWVLCRYNQIEAEIEDCTFPALVFMNKDGSVGKGLLTERIFPAMFGVDGVLPNAGMKDLIGIHNSAILNKCVVHINEAAMETTNASALKQVLGSPTIMVNPKFLPAFSIPNIMAIIISGNDKSSVVKLTGSKVDRRFSIIRTDRTFVAVLADYLTKEQPTEAFTDSEVANYTQELALKIFANREEVGKWLGHLKKKYPNLLTIQALHGTDYAAATTIQKTLHDRLIERIFDDPHFDAICFKNMKLAYDCNFRSEGAGYTRRKVSAFRNDLEEAATKRGYKIARGYDQHNNATFVFHKLNFNSEDYSDQKYCEYQANGEKISTITVL